MNPRDVANSLPDYNREVDKQPRPYIVFDLRAQEVRGPDGEVTHKDVPWVQVTSPGSKDVLEKLASDWIASLDQQVAMGRVPRSWPSDYKKALAQWMETQEMPLMGTPIKTWSGLTPAQRKNVLGVNILTVEDLALANDEMVQRIGMGGRELKRVAEAYVADKNGPGALAKQMEALLVRQNELEERNKALEASNLSMKALLPATEEKVHATGQVELSVEA